MSSVSASVFSETSDRYLLLSVDGKGDKTWIPHVSGWKYICIYIDECKRWFRGQQLATPL